ncbi:hypothetical protein JYU34_001667 [Plutella xylostella]|uniref:Uncharacterized protein n=1 Tax=Plutella xylostella TaxID=51655 RepID=A0ABQ7R4I0_PLUXY|nr:hypothetical protein JYU34_001667 [Plutella xylostella]
MMTMQNSSSRTSSTMSMTSQTISRPSSSYKMKSSSTITPTASFSSHPSQPACRFHGHRDHQLAAEMREPGHTLEQTDCSDLAVHFGQP